MRYKKIIAAILACLFACSVQASDNTHAMHIDSRYSWQQLPNAIKAYYHSSARNNPLSLTRNDITSIHHWQDANGYNFLLQFKRPKNYEGQRFSNNNTVKNELVSHLYVINGRDVKRLWQVYDFMESCDLDVVADYAEDSVIVSDVNANGISEVAISYYLGCRGGVDPDYMKVIMYEGQQKFAMRGSSAICNAQTHQPVDRIGDYGGDFEFDDALFAQSHLSQQDRSLFESHLNSVWQTNQCSIYFDYTSQ